MGADNRLLDLDERLFQNIFDDAEIGMTITSPDGEYIRVNDAFCRFVGYSSDELLKMNVRDVTYPEDLAATLSAREEAIQGHRLTDENAKRYTKKDGTIVWGLVTRSFVGSGSDGSGLIVGQIQDFTNRVTTELALRRSEQNFRRVFQSSPTMISISDAETGIVYAVNDKWLHTLGFERDKVVGTTPRNLKISVGGNIREQVTERLHQEKSVTGVEAQLRCHSGEIIDVVIGGERIEYEGRVCLLLACQDVTAEKRTEAHLRQSKKLESLGQLTGGIAHDFNNLMAAVMGNIEIVLDQIPQSPESVKHLEQSVKIIQRGEARR